MKSTTAYSTRANTRIWRGEHQTWIRYNAFPIIGIRIHYETYFPTKKLHTLKARGIAYTLVDRA